MNPFVMVVNSHSKYLGHKQGKLIAHNIMYISNITSLPTFPYPKYMKMQIHCVGYTKVCS